MRFIEFNKYCRKCEHYKDDSYEEPCDSCLSTPATDYSHKPINFKEASDAKVHQKLTIREEHEKTE